MKKTIATFIIAFISITMSYAQTWNIEHHPYDELLEVEAYTSYDYDDTFYMSERNGKISIDFNDKIFDELDIEEVEACEGANKLEAGTLIGFYKDGKLIDKAETTLFCGIHNLPTTYLAGSTIIIIEVRDDALETKIAKWLKAEGDIRFVSGDFDYTVKHI